MSSPILAGLVTLVLTLTLVISKWSDSRPPDTLQRPLDEFPTSLGGWEMKSSTQLDPGVLAKLIPTAYIDRQYVKGSSQVELFIAYYNTQRAGESMHSPKNCLPGAGWEIWDYGTASLSMEGRSVDVNKFFVQNGSARGVVLYWYQTRDRVIADEYRAKIFLVWDRMTKGHTSGSIIRINGADRPGALEDEEQFGRAALPAMERILGR